VKSYKKIVENGKEMDKKIGQVFQHAYTIPEVVGLVLLAQVA